MLNSAAIIIDLSLLIIIFQMCKLIIYTYGYHIYNNVIISYKYVCQKQSQNKTIKYVTI